MTDSDPPKQDKKEAHAPIVKVVLVGHCGFDQASLGRSVTAVLPGIEVESVYDSAGLDRHAAPDALLLINRVLDGRFGTGSGVDLIKELADQELPPVMMLISNYPDAQAKAIEAGALPGFGKNEMARPETAQKLQEAAQATT